MSTVARPPSRAQCGARRRSLPGCPRPRLLVACCTIATGSIMIPGCTSQPPREPRCLVPPPSDSPAIARVGDAVITMAQIEQRLREQGSAAQRFNDAAALRRFVEDQVRFELLVQAAFERGLDNDPDVVEAARKVMVRKLLQQDMETVSGPSEADEKAIRTYYENHIQEYQQPEKRRIAHIELLPTADGRARAQSLLNQLQTLPAAEVATTFRGLAADNSADRQTRGRGGEFESFVSHDELEQKLGQNFADEAFRLGAGQLAPAPVQSMHGWHVVYVIARRDALARNLEEVRTDIRDRLLSSQRAQMFDKYLREIRQRYPVALQEDRLPELIARLSGAKP